MVHLNDSKADARLAARPPRAPRRRRDGRGAGLARLLTHPALAHVTYFLETPGMDQGYDAVNMARARGAGRRPAARSSRRGREFRGSRSRAVPRRSPGRDPPVADAVRPAEAERDPGHRRPDRRRERANAGAPVRRRSLSPRPGRGGCSRDGRCDRCYGLPEGRRTSIGAGRTVETRRSVERPTTEASGLELERASDRSWSPGRGALDDRPRVAAHPDGEVVLHDLADLRLAEGVVRAQRVLDAGGRVDRGPARHEAQVLRGVRVVAQLAQAAGQLGGGAQRRGPVAADEAGDRRVVDARRLGQLALRHLLGLELCAQPLVEGAAVLLGHYRWALRGFGGMSAWRHYREWRIREP